MSESNDIVAVGLNLKPETLLTAYENGVFPWPSPGLPLLWYCPMKRGLLRFEDFHIPRRLKQYLDRSTWKFTSDRAFEQVLEGCSERGDEETWITDDMKAAYLNLHRLGHAHSIEVWNEEKLVGGLYGVDVAGYFAGESMFHRESNASKAALICTVSLLKRAKRKWMDIQVITPHMEAMGAKLVTRNKFLKLLEEGKTAEGASLKPFGANEILSASDLYKFI